MEKFFNPLDDIQDSQVSTSSLMNDVVGICPKCKEPFGSAVVNNDTVYYCDTCRVSQPIPQ